MAERHVFQDEWLLPLLEDIPGYDEELVRTWREQKRPFLVQAIVDNGWLPFEQVAGLVEQKYHITSADPGPDDVNAETLPLVPEKLCRRYALMPLDTADESVRIAMANPLNLEARKQVGWAAGRRIEPRYTLPLNIDRLIARVLDSDVTVFNTLDRIEPSEKVEILQGPDREGEEEPVRAPVIRLVNALLLKALDLRASDIHIEHAERSTEVRFRIDGQLRKIMTIPKYVGAGPLIARLKIMGRLDIAEHFKPQDGQARIRVGERGVTLRLSILPAQHGEKAVVRMLSDEKGGVSLEQLGLRPETLKRFGRMLQNKEGVVLVTGPTGSGKSTTLRAAITRIQTPEINIVTVEDPVEYQIEEATQVQVDVKKGLTFASALRSVLRQDPDVVLVGEIRDRETAEIATQASLTGHLVFSTLHTNDAPTAVVRLADMGIEPFKISASLKGVVGQRLVRRLCPHCAAVVSPEQMDDAIREALQRRGYEPRYLKPGGCEACDFNGYRGRLALMELLEVDDELAQQVADGSNTEALRHFARSHDLLYPLEEDALWHLVNGDTSLEEVQGHLDLLRLTGEMERGDERGAGSEEEGPSDSVRHVLVADSDPDTLKLLQDGLGVEDCRIDSAESADVTLRRIASDPPDVLILGFDFPAGAGMKILQALRGPLGMATLPVIGIVEEDTSLRSIRSAGADDFLVRPVDDESARQRLMAALFRLDAWSESAEIALPRTPANEQERLKALKATGLLDTGPEERFDHLTRMAQRMFSVPIAVLTLIDEKKQYFKSHQGLDTEETPRSVAFCAHAINGDETMVIPDALLDPRFSENPLVQGPPHIRFYAGYPVKSPGGYKLGAFCIIDRSPRELGEKERQALEDLGRMVELELIR